MGLIRPNIDNGSSSTTSTSVSIFDDPAIKTLVLTGFGGIPAAHNARIAVWAESAGTTDYEFPSGIVRWVSSSAADTNSIFVIGVDQNYELQTETVVMNGVTPVLSAFSWRAINEAYTLGTVGAIICTNPAVTELYAGIVATTSNSFSPNCWPMSQFSNYVIPVGYVGVISGLHAYGSNGGGSMAPGGISVKDFTESPPIFRPIADWIPGQSSVEAGSGNILTRPMAFPEKTAIQWRSNAPDAGTMTLFTSMTLSLVPQTP